MKTIATKYGLRPAFSWAQPWHCPPRYFDDVGDLGSLSIRVVVIFEEAEVTVSWTGGPRVRLQSRNNLTDGAWQDVAETAGQSSKMFMVPFADPNAASMFFRLVGP